MERYFEVIRKDDDIVFVKRGITFVGVHQCNSRFADALNFRKRSHEPVTSDPVNNQWKLGRQ